MSSPTIVVNAFNRPASLARLLAAIGRAQIPDGVRLLIPIDRGGDPAVQKAAEAFKWPFGPKEVIPAAEKLGVVGHFLRCGDLSGRYGDLVYLEDDLYVSAQFYRYAALALDAYRGDGRIAAAALNSIHFNGYTHAPFWPLPDSGDTFFMQVYWCHGLAFSAGMWADLRAWWDQTERGISPEDGLHPLFESGIGWRDEFFPAAMKYLRQAGKFVAFPRQSYTTNFGESGAHFERPTTFFQSPLQAHRRDLRLLSLDESRAVYDSYYELLPEKFGRAIEGAFDVDLYGTKPLQALVCERVLTTRRVQAAQRRWGLALRPPELNVLEAIPGRGISLTRREDLRLGRLDSWLNRRDRLDYFQPYRTSLRRRIYYALSRQVLREEG